MPSSLYQIALTQRWPSVPEPVKFQVRSDRPRIQRIVRTLFAQKFGRVWRLPKKWRVPVVKRKHRVKRETVRS